MRALSWVPTTFVVALLTVSLPASAESQELSESEAIARALADNVRLRAVRARPAQTAVEQQLRRLPPNPTFTFTQEGSAGTRDRFFLVQQELPTSGRLGLLRQAGAAAVLADDLRVRQAEFEVRQDVRSAFARLTAAQTRVQNVTEMLATLEGLTNRLAERERAGDGSLFDRLRAERELADVKAERRAAEGRLVDARASLAALLGMTGAPPLRAAAPPGALVPVPSLEIALATARGRSPPEA